MTVNLLELVQGQLSGSVMSNLGGLLGTDKKQTASAVAAVAPSLLGGLMKQGSTDEGAGALGSILDKFDGGILENLGGMFSGGKDKGMMDIGGNLIGGLFGGSLGKITDLLAKATGLGGGKIGSLLKMLAPVVFGVLAKQKGILGLGVAGLAKLLMGQGKFLKGLMPAGMGETLGINSLLGASDAPAGKAPLQSAPGSKGSMLAKLVPLALVATLGYYGYTKFIAPNEVQASDSGAVAISTELGDTFEGITTSLGSVTDAASAEAALPSLETAAAGLSGIATSANALPEAARGPLRMLASKFLPSFEGTIEKVMGLGGVKDVLGPVIGTILEKVKGLAG